MGEQEATGDRGPRLTVFPAVSIEDRIDRVLGLACELWDQGPTSWPGYYGAIFGPAGALRRDLDPRDLAAFEASRACGQILGMLARVREKRPGDQPIQVITIRVPRVLHETLKLEVAELGLVGVWSSLNQLCLSKLIRPIPLAQVPNKGRPGPRAA